MTRDDIIRMAREAGAIILDGTPVHTAFIERFASLVAATEREACAKVCESAVWGADIDEWRSMTKRDVSARSMHECAAAIRARSQQTGVDHD